MVVHPGDVEFAKKWFWQDETAIVTATQRRLGPGMSLINPTTVVVTNKRILIINRATLGLRKDVETIPFNRVTSVRVENGFISSSVYLRVSGYSSGEQGFLKPGEDEGQIDGLHQQDAKDLADYVDKVISGEISSGSQPDMPTAPQQAPQPQRPARQTSSSVTVYCPKCKARNDSAAAFCEMCGAKLGN